ncbi:MAG: nucleoside-diphosphate sugar epimerase/dehydratase [Clostridium sp.]|uniref:polysaccharide biosynthesis protein n=1 Tax=uncultured Clostridium sp. TaxID=59620 RepID=UPI0025E22CF0|nr:nucleoside-diphosphate sugar epimerase/dehydratase [Clostridium sp.]MDY2630725.1 nucleoside-diphosphate sugar epimerase/dehydratase [Clostridium sp.]
MKELGKYRKYILVLIDAILINLSYILAIYFRYDYGVFVELVNDYEKLSIIFIIIYLISFYLFKLYESIWNYASLDEFVLVIGACITGNILSSIISVLLKVDFSYAVNILSGIFVILSIVGFRVSFRIYGRFTNIVDSNSNSRKLKNTLIIGAGEATTLVIKEMKNNKNSKYNPLALIDDNVYKVGKSVLGVKIEGTRKDIVKVCKEKKIEIIIISAPSMNEEDKKEILDICKKTECRVQIVPSLYSVIDGNVALSQIKDVDIEDLLGRKPVELEMKGISDYINNKSVLVTGGGGSIGSELCRQIAKFNPSKLIIFDIYENNAYDIQNELKHRYPNLNLLVLIGSVRDKKRLEQVFKKYSPNLVFHAAAHKHVPLMEDSPMEAIKNNVFGTLNAVECADKYNCERFVLVSTDKAVNPTNVMGATKRICEMIIQSYDKVSKTKFVAVRFGNVLGSNGSVIPLFKKQISHGGPVTVTDKNIIRYFMTIPEAAKLVLQAGAFAKGGEIFVLDMGEPVKIYDLAYDLIRLSGYEPNKEIKIKITGLRPGEKLYEELLMSEEGLSNTNHKKIFVGKPTFTNIDALMKSLKELYEIVEKDNNKELISKLEEIVPTYKKKKDEVAVTI